MTTKVRFGLLLAAIVLFCGAGSIAKSLTASEILGLVNHDRISHGLSELTLNPILNLAALAKAEDMLARDYFSHEAPDGTQPWYWFKASGYNYTYAGENLAEGYTDPTDLEKSWMESPSHRANILSPFYSEVGLAVVNEHNTNIIVQFFGSKDNKVTLRQ